MIRAVLDAVVRLQSTLYMNMNLVRLVRIIRWNRLDRKEPEVDCLFGWSSKFSCMFILKVV
ncbi:hypothetical protein Hanom_Chr02g00102571 [Helianthus anomalus]